MRGRREILHLCVYDCVCEYVLERVCETKREGDDKMRNTMIWGQPMCGSVSKELVYVCACACKHIMSLWPFTLATLVTERNMPWADNIFQSEHTSVQGHARVCVFVDVYGCVCVCVYVCVINYLSGMKQDSNNLLV